MSNVLVVEDDFELSEIFAEMLSDSGLGCQVIGDGQAAVTWLDSHTPDAIMLDMHLPGLSGIDIIKYIRSQDRLQHVPVIAVTADSSLVDLLEKRADLVLLKPVGYIEFMTLIKRLMKTVPSG